MACSSYNQIYTGRSRVVTTVACAVCFTCFLFCFNINASSGLIAPSRRVDVRLEASSPVTTRAHIARVARRLRAYTEEEVQRLIEHHATTMGVEPDLPLAIARCESGLKWNAASRSSTARGVFQYLAGTWKNTTAGRSGVSALDADANVRMAVAHIALKGTAPWNASRRCWDT